MPEQVERGFVPTDAREFNDAAQALLRRAQQETAYLLEHGYAMEQSVTFVGNHYQLSARQRMALTRTTATETALRARTEKRRTAARGETVLLDGLNQIITLESALSSSATLLRGMDGAVRDLCGLHGTYRLIDKTDWAIALIAAQLRQYGCTKATFYLDQPVSNTGRLRQRILNMLAGGECAVTVELVPDADKMLWGKSYVATSDAGILDRCDSWLNLAADAVAAWLPKRRFVWLDGGCVG